MASAIKDAARIDDHAWRVNFSRHNTLGLDLHSPLCENHSVKAAGDYHAIAFDLTFDFCALAKNYSLFRDDVSLYVAVDAERSGDC